MLTYICTSVQEMRIEWLTGRPVGNNVRWTLHLPRDVITEPNLGEPEMAIVPIVSTEFHRDGAIIDSIQSRPDPVGSDRKASPQTE